MAFNPLHQFRKHQKAFLAGLTIVCMIIFVLQFGRGDPLERFSSLIGARSRKAMVATLYARDVSRDDIVLLRDQRLMANAFMMQVNDQALIKVTRQKFELSKVLGKVEELKTTLPQLLQYGLIPGFTDQMVEQLDKIQNQLERSQKSAEADSVKFFKETLYGESALRMRKLVTGRGRLYFGGSTTAEGLLDFLILDHEADRLGIQLTGGTVIDLIRKETANQFDSEIFKASAQALRRGSERFTNVSRNAILSALNAEFRVRMAEVALLGYNPGSYGSRWPAPITPYEFWQFYKNQIRQSDVDLLPIPVRSPEFLAKIGQPSKNELEEFFAKYKDVEPSPTSLTPGFKHAATIKVEWIKTDLNRQREEAAKAGKVIRSLQQMFAGGIPTGDVASTAVNAALPVAFDLRLICAYGASQWQFRLPGWTEPDFALPFYTSLYRPENAAAVFGQIVAAGSTQATILAPLNEQMAVVAGEVAEVKPLVERELARPMSLAANLALGAAGPFPATLAGAWQYGRGFDQYLPFDAVKKRLEERERNRLAKTLARNALTLFEDEIRARNKLQTLEDLRLYQKLNSPETVAMSLAALASGGTGSLGLPAAANIVRTAKANEYAGRAAQVVVAGTSPVALSGVVVMLQDQALSQAFIKDFVAGEIERLGLEHGETVKFRDQNDIAQDEGLKPLKEAALSSMGGIQGEDPLSRFASNFFRSPATGGSADLYVPERFENEFLFWRTAEKPAYVPDLAEVQAKVKDWWQLEKARVLARTEADDLAAKAQKAGDAERTLKDESLRFGSKIIELKRVARLIPPPEKVPVMSQDQFQTYPKPKEIEYPKPDWQSFLDELLDKLKNKSDTVVLTNQPEDVFYVAALVKEPNEPSRGALATFYQAYRSQPYNLITRLDKENRFQQEYRQALLETLRKEAGLQINDKLIKTMDKSPTLDDR